MGKNNKKTSRCSLFDPIYRRLRILFSLLRKIFHKEIRMSQELEALQVKVAELQTSVTLAISVLTSLRDQLAAQIDPQSLVVLTTQLDSIKSALDVAVIPPEVPPETPPQ